MTRCMLLIDLCCTALLATNLFADQTSQRPNFIFIQGEGQGWARMSVQLDPNEPESRSTSFHTPNLERLAREGVRFSNYYAPSPRCTPGRNGPLQGGKGGLWDGGLRIPLFIRGPDAAAGAHSSVRVTGADLVPTIADLAGVADALSKDVEGGTLKELLAHPAAGSVKRPRDELVFHFPHYDKESLGPVSAILVDNFKLIRVYESGGHLLFDLSKDIGEQKNLAASMPEKVRELERRLTEYLAAVDADLPMAGDPLLETPDRNADGLNVRGSKGGGQGGKGGSKGGGRAKPPAKK